MSNLNSVFGKAMTAEEYSSQWQIDSDNFVVTGIYDWMSEQLGNPKLVVEVGCGTGRSTAALAKTSRVICVEPNFHMAAACHQYLAAKGVSSQISQSLNVDTDTQVNILVADIFDSAIENCLSSVNPDAITCWLIGAEPERIATHLNKELVSFEGGEMPQYREKVHRRCYELGEIIFPSEGVIHITDRLFILSWIQKDDARHSLAEMHQEFGGDNYEIPFNSTRFIRFQQPFSASKIQMMTDGNPDETITVFGSVKGYFTCK